VGYSDIVSAADALALMPTEQRMEIIKATLDQSFGMRMCRKLRNMSAGTTTLKVSSELATGGFVNGPNSSTGAPGALIETTTANWEDVVMTAEKIATFVVIDNDSIADSQVDLFGEIKEQVSADIAKRFDAAVFAGTGAPASWPSGGVRTHAVNAGNSLAIGGIGDLYDDLLGVSGAFALAEADGFEVNGVAAAVTLKSRMRGLRDSDGNPIFNRTPGQGMGYELDGNPLSFPKHGGFPSSNTHLIAGDWSNAVWAMRQDLAIKLITEGVLTDAAGNITHNLSQQDMVALRFTIRLGFALPNPVNQLQPTKASRSPFCVLTT
jgi:HK97 family phage major capsid protein